MAYHPQTAEKLGVSVQDQERAIIENSGRNLDTAAAAKALGVNETTLKAGLPSQP